MSSNGVIAMQAHSTAMEAVLSAAAAQKPRPAVVAVGATVQDGFSAAAKQMGWMESPSQVVVGEASAKFPFPFSKFLG